LATGARVGLLHYTGPPIIGGVETILYEQATRLAARGHLVTVLSGRGGPFPPAAGIKLVIIPELDSKYPEVSAIRDGLDRGHVPPGFAPLQATIQRRLEPALTELDSLIVHNALSLHFNLPLTAALWKIAERGHPRIISWVHDLSWVNPLYRPLMQEREPWDLLRRPNPNITSVFVSGQRLDEWQELTGVEVDANHVIPNGIDPGALFKLGPVAKELAERFELGETDVVLLAPVRITRRKNLEWAIEAAAAVRASGRSVQLLITGPPGPHNPLALEYVQELKQLTEVMGMQQSVRFLFEQNASATDGYAIDAATLSDLYMLSDVVTLPSSSEGFGLPLAEAAIFRVPVVCTDLPAFREVAPEGVRFVPLADGPAAFAAAVLQALESPVARLRHRVIKALAWDRIVAERIEPLLSST
jgi:glycosyltransferase involved in cell wall biosynthesis